MSNRSVAVPDRVAEHQVEEVLALVRAATEHDGVAPMSEQALLVLRHGGMDTARSLLMAGPDETIIGYGHLQPPHDGEPASAELVVHPGHRRCGHGRALAEALLHTAGGPLRIWAHGDLAAAAALAASLRLTRTRVLLQLRRPLADPFPDVRLPPGIRLRPFEPGRDEAAWLEVNRRAFAHHPEQGSWTAQDLLDREREPWFDPAGFFLAVGSGGRLAGFHWTKVHDRALGEVYVVGVDPAEQGTGLGRALTLAGLHHLRSLGLPTVMLYVDEANGVAVRLYESLGFVRYAVDVMYARPPR